MCLIGDISFKARYFAEGCRGQVSLRFFVSFMFLVQCLYVLVCSPPVCVCIYAQKEKKKKHTHIFRLAILFAI